MHALLCLLNCIGLDNLIVRITLVQITFHHRDTKDTERNFIRIPEKGILIKEFVFFPKGSIYSIFLPLRGKYYKK